MTAKLHTGKCFTDAVDVGERLRSVDPERVAALAESIDAIGLQQPISVWSPDDDTLDLVAGLHRLEAIKKLGWEEIDCIFVDMDNLDRQLWEIDENLIRADLTDLQRAQHTARRAEVVKQKVELDKLAKTEPDPSQNANKGQGEFVAETAKKTGKSEKTVRRDKSRGEKIPEDVQKDLAGTKIEDSGVQLDALARASPDEQREAVKAVTLGHAKDVREVLPGADKKQSDRIGGVNYDRLCRAWNACSEDEQGRFLVHIGWDSKS
jgi:ParB-like chromosome segregation protein Spo0J